MRKKVKLALIENDSKRKATYKKRKSGMLKKVQELATLCDVKIAVVINSSFEANSEVWPSKEGVDEVVSDFQKLSVADQTKRMVNQETFLKQRITKATESWKKLWKENRELEMKNLMFDCISGKTSVSRIPERDREDFIFVLDKYLNDVYRSIEKMNDEASSSSAVAPATTTSVVMPMGEMGSSSVGFYDQIRDRIEENLNRKDFDLNQKQW